MNSAEQKLSPRGCEILRLVAQGLANKEVARALRPPCAEETVKSHLRVIYARLGVRNRAQAVAQWLQAEPTHSA
jgi:LuxR family transcriptional regulator, maltose regulon positive regulatory protein